MSSMNKIALVFFFIMSIAGTTLVLTQVTNASSLPQIVATAGQPFIITDDLKQTIRTLVDNGTNAAVVVGLVDANGSQFFGYGQTSNATNATTVNEDTLFDLGSITKTFTTTLLADMVIRGEINLDDPLENYLPATVKVPAFNGIKITLQDLATHTSGLPDYPPNAHVNITTYPDLYPNYTEEKLYQALSNITLTTAPGSHFQYSDMGMALLGQALSLKAGMPYEQLVTDRILDVLGMNSTRITLSDNPTLLSRLALGHLNNGTEIPVTNVSYVFPTPEAPAGSLRSSASDMVKYLSANMGLIKTSLEEAMQDSHSIRLYTNQSTGPYDVYIGLGWFSSTNFGSQIIWHNGEVLGYNTFVGFNPVTQRGVVVLSSTMLNDIDVAFIALKPDSELSKSIWSLLISK